MSYYSLEEESDYDKFSSPKTITIKQSGSGSGVFLVSSITANKFIKKGSTSNDILLGDGTTAPLDKINLDLQSVKDKT